MTNGPMGDATSEPRRVPASWRWPLVVLGLALIGGGLYYLTLQRLTELGRTVAAAPAGVVSGLERLVGGLLRGEVTQRFLSSIPVVSSTPAGRLELATAEVVETISRTEERSAFFELLPLGATTVEIRVPVVYRYHVAMDGEWHVTVTDDRAEIVAPPLRPSLPPAVRTDRMERRVEADWRRFDGAARLAELESQLTPMLVARARDPQHLALVRDEARRALAGFARGWLLGEGAAASEIRSLTVRFADEPATPADTTFPVGRD